MIPTCLSEGVLEVLPARGLKVKEKKGACIRYIQEVWNHRHFKENENAICKLASNTRSACGTHTLKSVTVKFAHSWVIVNGPTLVVNSLLSFGVPDFFAYTCLEQSPGKEYHGIQVRRFWESFPATTSANSMPRHWIKLGLPLHNAERQ